MGKKIMRFLYILTCGLMLPTLLAALGQPEDWQLSFQDPASPLMRELINFHDLVFWIITAITVFVFLL